MVTRIALVLDCADPEGLAAFWGETLGYVNVGTYEPYVVIVDPDDKAPRLLLQKVDEPKAGKNRMHIDLHPADVDAEVARLVALGATKLDPNLREAHGTSWILMADPEGNEFCVCSGD